MNRLILMSVLATLTTLTFANSAWAEQFDEVPGMKSLAKTSASCPGGVCADQATCDRLKRNINTVLAACNNLDMSSTPGVVPPLVKSCNDRVQALGTCNSIPSCADKNCDNGNPCDGIETCDPSLGCRPGTLVTCNHGKCNPTNGKCNCDKGWTLVGKICNKINVQPDAGTVTPPPEPDAGTLPMAVAGVSDPCLDLRSALANSEAARNSMENELRKAKTQVETLSNLKCAPSKVIAFGIPAIGFLLLLIILLLVGLSLGKLPRKK